MNAISLRNFRCFFDPGMVPIARLTFLVGENSTGKSSFLAAMRLAWDIAYSGRRIDFNEEPFLLGAFDQIAHYRGGKAGRADTFEIGLSVDPPDDRVNEPGSDTLNESTWFYGAEFERSGSHPVFTRQVLRAADIHLSVSLAEDAQRPKLEIRLNDKRVFRTLEEANFPVRLSAESPIDWTYVLFAVPDLRTLHGQPLAQKTGLTPEEVQRVLRLLQRAHLRSGRRPVAVAPVRSRPERTYNPVSTTPLPEGGHVPMVLAKLFFEDKDRWKRLTDALNQFGTNSGLFSLLGIKPLGRHESDPFQLQVKILGPAMNLVDVGYGVSQALPIVVDALLAPKGSLFLLQQPEVHLHPRAQAALGTLLGDLAASHAERFVVETHSDYMIDRVRMDIREKRAIKAEDVLILYFERRGVEVRVHPINIDNTGNLVGVPASYRKFFLEEERRFLGA